MRIERLLLATFDDCYELVSGNDRDTLDAFPNLAKMIFHFEGLNIPIVMLSYASIECR
jgi:hypothetical protein